MTADLPNTDPVFDRLAQLQPHDFAPQASEHLRLQAQHLLARSKRLATRPWLAHVERFYDRFLEPALVAATCSVYLFWASRTLDALHR